MRSPLRSFDETARLPLDELRDLLREGHPEERVWAAWTLGLLLGGGFASEAAQRTGAEPSAGVRRQLAVVLAGLQERAAIDSLAASDPDPYVRATAHKLKLQLASGAPGAVTALLTAVLSDQSAVVKEEGLRILERTWPRDRLMDLIGLLSESALGIRQAVTDHQAEHSLGAAEAGAAALYAVAESDPDLRRRLRAILLRHGAAGALVAALPGLSEEIILESLDQAVQAGVRLPWAALAVLGPGTRPRVDLRILRLVREAGEVDWIWLLDCAARAVERRRSGAKVAWQIESDVRETGELARAMLADRLGKGQAPPTTPRTLERASTIIDGIREEERWAQEEHADFDDETDEEHPGPWLGDLVEQREALERYLAHGGAPAT